MSITLFRTLMKSHLKSVLSYGIGTAFYLILLIYLYPSFAGSPALNSLLKSLPEGMLKLIGYQAGISNVGDYIAGEYYSLLYIIIVGIYAITAGVRLLAHMVDTGSMAYLLATPVSRVRILVTEFVVLLLGLFLIGCLTTVAGLLGVHLFVSDTGMEAGHFTVDFIRLNIVGTLLFAVVGAYTFLFATLAPDERTAASLASGITLIFYALNLLGTLADKFAWMRHLSLFTAFNAQQLMHGKGDFTVIAVGLIVATFCIAGTAVWTFSRRQFSF